MNEAVVRACAVVGGQANLARALEVSAPTVNQWAAGIRDVPLDRCVPIECLTGVRCKELRPDKVSYFSYLRASASVGERAMGETQERQRA